MVSGAITDRPEWVDGAMDMRSELQSEVRPAARRYSAFISYSREDVRFVRRLHGKLEGYRPPRRVVAGAPSVLGPDGRLKPIFRDEDDFGAAADLSDAIREGIGQSECLIVVCSPSAAASDWVGREIDLFRALHGDGRILTALLAGSPKEAFHPSLLRHADGAEGEPLAADFRPGRAAFGQALLKLVAGLIDTPLDELVHRDAQRQIRRAVGFSAAAALAVIAMAGLGAMAFVAQVNETAQRQRAEGLGAFMLKDLRKRLQAAGRLDVSVAVNTAALKYLRDQDLAKLSADQLTQRAAALHALGEDYEKRGDLAGARKQFEEAQRTTQALLAKAPNDPKRIFAHAQSQYYVGFINWRDGADTDARTGFEEYARSAQRLYALDPHNPDWRHELAYSELNLGMLDLRQAGRSASAERHFLAALQQLQSISAGAPNDVDLLRELADAHAWIADSQRLQGDHERAFASREQERRIIDHLIQGDARNVLFRSDGWVTS